MMGRELHTDRKRDPVVALIFFNDLGISNSLAAPFDTSSIILSLYVKPEILLAHKNKMLTTGLVKMSSISVELCGCLEELDLVH